MFVGLGRMRKGKPIKQSANVGRPTVAQQMQQHKKDLLVTLEKSLGVVTEACRKAGIDRACFYRYYNADAEFKAAVDELDNVALDFAESQLHKQIESGVPASTIFYLKTRGKERGYIERSEVTGKEGKDLMPKQIIVEILKNDGNGTTTD